MVLTDAVVTTTPKKLAENRYEPLRLLDVGQVSTAGDEFESALFEAGGPAPADKKGPRERRCRVCKSC